MKHEKTIRSMTLEQKCALLSGADTFRTRGMKEVPSIWLSDGPHGLRKQEGASDHLGLHSSRKATCFPTATTIANSWNEQLGEEIGRALGTEAAEQQVAVVLGPGLNMKRNPLCGRNFEYFSEDPYLAGKLAAAYVRGIQETGISACPKHFAVNNQELRRMATDSIVDERTLREIYLTGFEIAVKEGQPSCIMTSYNKVNGTYANENEHLLVDILRKEWGYDRAVVTDWGGSNDHALGVKCGSTLEMPAPGLDSVRELMAAVQSGKIAESDVDARLDELITLVLDAQPALQNARPADMDAHHMLARKAAAESIVLLKNENGLLPLAEGTKVALIGDFAFTPRYQGAGSSVVNAAQVASLAEEIAGSGLDCIGMAKGYERSGARNAALEKDAVELAANADVALMCLGLTELDECEGLDRTHMRLAENQIALMTAVREKAKKVVVLFHAGSAVEMPWLDKCDALLHAALGGQAGASAMLDALTGKVNPSGKLAETWPSHYEDTPSLHHFGGNGVNVEYREGPFIGYRYYQKVGKKVLFPFGFGLSYTSFAYENLTVNPSCATLTVRNTGKRAGAEVVQLYVHKPDSKLPMPVQELKGFVKVFLQPGERREVCIPLDDKAFRYWNVKTNRWEIEGGEYEIRIGASSEDIRLNKTVTVAGTGAPAPYDAADLPSYFSGRVQNVPQAEFEKLLGRPVPADKPAIDRNMVLGQLHHSRVPIGWAIGGLMNLMLVHKQKKGTVDLNFLFLHNMPLRAIAKMTNGWVSMGVIDGLVMELKGFLVIGLCKAGYELVKNLILNAWQQKRLK
ncbi:MAG: glycoside hydrolase family 3 C-terminal domain-containing protein [Clostridiales bacterium]|nr:glycoside hydrolase family 3 C-terminal domain-containing protein [Clostridiales bacterium]